MKSRAFTLFELLIVLSIISIIFFLAVPRFISSVNPERTRSFVLRLYNTLLYVNDKSIIAKKVYLFTIDLTERRYFFTLSEEGNPEGEVNDRYLKPVQFPDKLIVDGVHIIPGDEVSEGKAVVPFTPRGMLYSFEVRLKENEERFYVLRGDSISNQILLLKTSGEKEEVISR